MLQIALHGFHREQGRLALQRRSDGQAGPYGAVNLMCYTCHQPPKGRKFFSFDQGVLGVLEISQRCLGRIPGAADLLLVALALADVDVGTYPAIHGANCIAERNGARQEWTILSILSAQG